MIKKFKSLFAVVLFICFSSLYYFTNGNFIFCDSSNRNLSALENNRYVFNRYKDTTNGIATNFGRDIAFSNDGALGYVGIEGGLSIGIKNGSSYTFTNYNTSTSGITNNNGYGVAFDNNDNVGYVSNGGGLSVGIKNNSSYTFTNYNTSTNGIASNNASDVAFDSNGNVGYASNGGGLSVGIKNDSSYVFTNYTTIYSTVSSAGFGVAFDSDNDVGYASYSGINIGTQNPTAYIETDNIIYEPNVSNNTNYSIEDFTISFNINLLSMINNLTGNNKFIQITVFDSLNKYYIGYITKDGNVPANNIRSPEYDSYIQKQAVVSSYTTDFVAEDIENNTIGFASNTTLDVSVKYGSSQSTLTEALQPNNRTISTPNMNPTILPYTYKSQSFATNYDNYVYDKEKNTYTISNISLAFDDNLKALLQPTTNPVPNFIEIDVYDGQNIDNSYISTIIYIVNTTDNKDEAISDVNKLQVDSNTYQEVINLNSISGDVTSFDNLNFHNLLANTNYNVAITYGASQINREDMIGSESGSTLSFVTPQAPAPNPEKPSNPSNDKSTNNTGAIAGGVVGGVVGICLIGVSGFFVYKKGLFKKR